MSGPRVSTGIDSKQDYGTPRDFLDAVEKRFGAIGMDLAAHAANHKFPRYFAPHHFIETLVENEVRPGLRDALIAQGADPDEVTRVLVYGDIDWSTASLKNGKRTKLYAFRNHDQKALAFDSLNQDWTAHLEGQLGFLNPEFSDIAPWAAKCRREARSGAVSGMLVPASVGSNWFRDIVAPFADTYLLNGRMSFDNKSPYPKDLMFCRYPAIKPDAPRIVLWDYRTDLVHQTWAKL